MSSAATIFIRIVSCLKNKPFNTGNNGNNNVFQNVGKCFWHFFSDSKSVLLLNGGVGGGLTNVQTFEELFLL